MTNDEIREAVSNKYGTTETQLKALKELAEEYLKIEGWPEERDKYVPSLCGGGYDMDNAFDDGFNEALHLCKLSYLKEKQE